jgi:hypothetical protein
MTTLRETLRRGAAAMLPLGAPLKEDGVELAMLWSTGHYDGPRTGVCMYRGRKHWFESICDGYGQRVAYLVVEVTEDDLRTEERRHDLFVALVGLHTDYRYEDGRRVRLGAQLPVTRLDEYHEQTSGPRRDFGEREVVAWWGATAEGLAASLAEGPDADTEDAAEEPGVMDVFSRVARRELTPEEGARLLHK